MRDPLGLTPDQRIRSNMFAAVRNRKLWWPDGVEPASEGRCSSTACGYCRAITGHAPDCITHLAATLDGLQADIAAREAE